jgi:hypothetical protein
MVFNSFRPRSSPIHFFHALLIDDCLSAYWIRVRSLERMAASITSKTRCHAWRIRTGSHVHDIFHRIGTEVTLGIAGEAEDHGEISLLHPFRLIGSTWRGVKGTLASEGSAGMLSGPGIDPEHG